MTKDQMIVAINTIWVVVAACLVLFMQAGFALLETGLTRAKNAAHVAVKNLVSFSVVCVVYWAVGFGLAFGDKAKGAASWVDKLVGTSGWIPSAQTFMHVGAAPYTWFTSTPAATSWFFEVVFAAVSVAIVWGGMAERAKLSVYIIFAALFTVTYSIASHWIWDGSGWLFHRGMQDFAGSTVVHYQGALGALAGALLLGPRIGRFDPKNRESVTAGHSLPLTVIGTLILWLGWMGFNPGSTLSVNFGGLGFFGYVALTTNLGAAGGLVGGMIASKLVFGKVEVANCCNGVLGALVAITAACAFVAPWAAVVVGLVAGLIAVAALPLMPKIGVDDPIGAVPVHGLAGIWGTLACGLFAAPALAKNVATGQGGLFYTGHFHQLGVQALGVVAVGAFSFSTSFGILWVMKHTIGIRVDEHAEVAGLDLAEHGASAYPETLSITAIEEIIVSADDLPRTRREQVPIASNP